MSRLSLRLRLTLAFAVAMALLLTATGLFLYVRLRSTLDEQIEHSLRARADDVAALVRTDSGLSGGGRLAETEESFAQVIGPDGVVRDASPGLAAAPLLRSELLARARRETTFAERGGARLLATPVRTRGETLVVVAGSSLEDRDEALDGLLAQLLIGAPIALLLSSLGGYLLAAATLRPIETMRRRAEDISATTAGRRLPVPGADDEVARLARTLNEMLARLEAGLERERRFVAEASHELRTPLSLLKAELELALRRPRSADELGAALSSAAEETDRLALLADDLLVLARSDEGRLRLAAEPLAVSELLGTVARRFGSRAGGSGRTLEVDAPDGAWVVGDPLRLEQALGNLVDNALRHGEGTVRLEARPQNGLVALRVTDEGAGFPPEFLPRAFERFSRADDARGRGGAGLGLALVEAIARAHGGTASAGNRAEGGAEVTLAVPSSASHLGALASAP